MYISGGRRRDEGVNRGVWYMGLGRANIYASGWLERERRREEKDHELLPAMHRVDARCTMLEMLRVVEPRAAGVGGLGCMIHLFTCFTR